MPWHVSTCGGKSKHQRDGQKSRQWTCNHCQTKHDRDINATKNIRDEGLRVLSLGTSESACCPDVRRNSGGRKKFTVVLSVEQEAPTSRA